MRPEVEMPGRLQKDGGAAKARRRTTRSAVAKKSASVVVVAVSAVKAAKNKKKRKRREASPPAVVTLSIPTPLSREVELEEEEEESEKEKDETIEELSVPERPARRSESPAAKRQRELVQKMSEDALRRGLEAQCSAAAAQARMPAAIKPQCFGRRLGFQLRRGKVLRVGSVFALII
jgi:hypothetical protein